MALTKCGECGNEVSTLAEACPRCGAPVVEGLTVDVDGTDLPVCVVFSKCKHCGSRLEPLPKVEALKAMKNDRRIKRFRWSGVLSYPVCRSCGKDNRY